MTIRCSRPSSSALLRDATDAIREFRARLGCAAILIEFDYGAVALAVLQRDGCLVERTHTVGLRNPTDARGELFSNANDSLQVLLIGCNVPTRKRGALRPTATTS